MPVDAKTIQIFLPDGDPRGVRIAEITTRIVQAVQVPRLRLEAAAGRPELKHVGVYFLFGESDEMAKPRVYIGQTEDLPGRLRSHHREKEFWTTGVVVVSRTDSFTLAHLKYLEWYSLQQATTAGRYVLENGNAGGRPFITEPMEADVLDAFETAGVLLSTLGFPVFQPLVGTPKTEAEERVYRCSGPDAAGQGRLTEDGFVVLKGSLARPTSVASAHKYITTKREALIAEHVLVPEGSSLRFTEDCLFETPSGAAMVVLGRTANGWQEWKDDEGRTLDKLERGETREP